MLSTRDLKAPNRAQHTGIAQMRLTSDDAVCDVVVDSRVLFLLDVLHGAIFEGPADDVGLGAGAFVFFGGFERGEPVVEEGEFDEI